MALSSVSVVANSLRLRRRQQDLVMATKERSTAILDVRPMLRGSEKAVVEAVLGPAGVERVEANPVAQTATVTYNPAETSLADLRRWVQECGMRAGQSVPNHICDPLMEPDPSDGHGHHPAVAVDTKAPAAARPPPDTAVPSAQPDHAPPGHGRTGARRACRSRRSRPSRGGGDALAARDDGPRRPRRHRWSHGRRHAQPLPGRGHLLDPDPAVVSDRPRGPRLHRRRPVRAARRRLVAAAEPAGDLLLLLDLLRWRRPRPCGPAPWT